MEIKLVGGPHDCFIGQQPDGIRCIAIAIEVDKPTIVNKVYEAHVYRGSDGVFSYEGINSVSINQAGDLIVYPQRMANVLLIDGPFDGQSFIVPAELGIIIAPYVTSDEELERIGKEVMSGGLVRKFQHAHIYRKEDSGWVYKGIKEIDLPNTQLKFGQMFKEGLGIEE